MKVTTIFIIFLLVMTNQDEMQFELIGQTQIYYLDEMEYFNINDERIDDQIIQRNLKLIQESNRHEDNIEPILFNPDDILLISDKIKQTGKYSVDENDRINDNQLENSKLQQKLLIKPSNDILLDSLNSQQIGFKSDSQAKFLELTEVSFNQDINVPKDDQLQTNLSIEDLNINNEDKSQQQSLIEKTQVFSVIKIETLGTPQIQEAETNFDVMDLQTNHKKGIELINGFTQDFENKENTQQQLKQQILNTIFRNLFLEDQTSIDLQTATRDQMKDSSFDMQPQKKEIMIQINRMEISFDVDTDFTSSLQDHQQNNAKIYQIGDTKISDINIEQLIEETNIKKQDQEIVKHQIWETLSEIPVTFTEDAAIQESQLKLLEEQDNKVDEYNVMEENDDFIVFDGKRVVDPELETLVNGQLKQFENSQASQLQQTQASQLNQQTQSINQKFLQSTQQSFQQDFLDVQSPLDDFVDEMFPKMQQNLVQNEVEVELIPKPLMIEKKKQPSFRQGMKKFDGILKVEQQVKIDPKAIVFSEPALSNNLEQITISKQESFLDEKKELQQKITEIVAVPNQIQGNEQIIQPDQELTLTQDDRGTNFESVIDKILEPTLSEKDTKYLQTSQIKDVEQIRNEKEIQVGLMKQKILEQSEMKAKSKVKTSTLHKSADDRAYQYESAFQGWIIDTKQQFYDQQNSFLQVQSQSSTPIIYTYQEVKMVHHPEQEAIQLQIDNFLDQQNNNQLIGQIRR